MYRQSQLADLLRIDELAIKANAEIATAIVLAARLDGIETVGAAEAYISTNPEKIAVLAQRQLYLEWIAEAIVRIRKKVTAIDLRKIGTFDEASRPTDKIFEDTVREINRDLFHDPSGIYPCISEIFDNPGSYTAETLDRIKNIKLFSDDIRRAVWRISYSFSYLIFDHRIIVGSVFAFFLAIPTWYFFGAHGQSLATLPEQGSDLIRQDIQQLRSLIEAQNRGSVGKISDLIHFIWEFTLIVPSIFLIPAALLGLARRTPWFKAVPLQEYEETFDKIGRQIAKLVPVKTKIPSVRINMSNIAIGTNIQQTVDSIVVDSFKKIEAGNDPSIQAFLKALGEKVKASGDLNAAEHYGGLIESIKNDRKGMARTMWDGLVKALPSVTAIAGAAGAIAKLFGP
jgi:hypothetical protein